MMILAHVQYGTKTIKHFRLANIGRLSLYTKHSTKCENVAMIQDKQVAKLRSTDDVLGICQFCKIVANFDRWLT
jgi:hypothetical protein